MQAPELRGLSLESFLIKPVQRICKYPLLIKVVFFFWFMKRGSEPPQELLKNTPAKHPDHDPLESALKRMEDVVTTVNSKTRALDDKEKIAELQNRIESSTPLELASVPNRKFFREGHIQRLVAGKLKDRYLILFSDVIILCKTTAMAKGKLQMDVMYPLDEATITTTISKPVGNSRWLRTMFEVIIDPTENVIISCMDDMDKQRWMSAFEEAFKTHPTRKRWSAIPTNTLSKSTSASSGFRNSTSGQSTSGTLKKSNTISMKIKFVSQ